MRVLVFVAAMVVAALPGRGVAQDVPLVGGWPGLPAMLADSTVERIARNPGIFVEDMVTMILGHGQNGRIDAQGFDDAVALARARTRARELHRFAVADLDGDGAVTRNEMEIAIRAQAARSKARLTLGHKAADTDGDGVASRAEIAAFAEATALRELGPQKAERLRALISMDADGDRAVSVDEVIAAVAAFRAAAASVAGGAMPAKSARSSDRLRL
ncbi:MAG: hypothetical protein AAGG09_19860 [Pseudomonadota bacterium]